MHHELLPDDSEQSQGIMPSYKIKKTVFWVPFALLITVVIISFVDAESFERGLSLSTQWILDNFAWLFNSTTLFCVIAVVIVYFSPLGKVRLGGSDAKPILSLINVIWITLCTTIASGILFWAAAEPIFHLNDPPVIAGAAPGSEGAALFAMKTMFLEWTWSPYSLYSVATILLAFVFFNMNKNPSIGSALVPLFGEKSKKWSNPVDTVCVFTLVMGMAASLGIGTLTIAGGLEHTFGINSGGTSWAVIIIVIVIAFVISSITGITKGIRLLSKINAFAYLGIFAFLIIVGPRAFMLNFGVESWGSYVSDFFRLSLYTGANDQESWAKIWPIFYWCNWLAWAPISAVFLAKLLRGHTVRQGVLCTFVIPAIFSTLWMGLFSTASLYFERNGAAFSSLLAKPETIIFAFFEKLPASAVVIPVYLWMVFLSFVTASDSNTNALGGLCTQHDGQREQDSPRWIKILWGVTIGLITWILLSSKGIDGIKAASNLGGFPNLFLMIFFVIALLKIAKNPKKYDVHQHDYDDKGHPLLLSPKTKQPEHAPQPDQIPTTGETDATH